jgi:hypothetical protein
VTLQKVSLTLDEGRLREARERVGPRGLSAYVDEALRRQLAHDRMGDFLAEAEAEVGPIPDEAMERARHEWDEAEREWRARMRKSA